MALSSIVQSSSEELGLEFHLFAILSDFDAANVNCQNFQDINSNLASAIDFRWHQALFDSYSFAVNEANAGRFVPFNANTPAWIGLSRKSDEEIGRDPIAGDFEHFNGNPDKSFFIGGNLPPWNVLQPDNAAGNELCVHASLLPDPNNVNNVIIRYDDVPCDTPAYFFCDNSSTPNPTVTPTITPTSSPTGVPTISPTNTITVAPTSSPTGVPTISPTITITVAPTGEALSFLEEGNNIIFLGAGLASLICLVCLACLFCLCCKRKEKVFRVSDGSVVGGKTEKQTEVIVKMKVPAHQASRLSFNPVNYIQAQSSTGGSTFAGDASTVSNSSGNQGYKSGGPPPGMRFPNGIPPQHAEFGEKRVSF